MKQFSLSELAYAIQAALSPLKYNTYWVRAEIASLMVRNGHSYWELAEKAPNGIYAAKMRATCWASLYPMLSAYFAEETGERLQTGMQVLVETEVGFHPVYGLSLNIVGIDPRYTIGDLARQKQETIRRLQEEGVWDMQQQLSLPTLTQRIAVISAAEAAGYGDFTHQLQLSHFRFLTTLYPAIMQGEKAEQSIIKVLNTIALHKNDYDAVVIIRGGGATTDLGCFDSYLLATTCAQFPLPILTGIGHTRDVSILDQIAHMTLKTPTAVADFLINRLNEQAEHITRLRQRLTQVYERQLLIKKHRIQMLRQRLELCSPERIYRLGYSLTTCNGQIVRDSTQLTTGQTITTHLQKGVIRSTIDNIAI